MVLIMEYTTNPSLVNIDATLAHYNIKAETRTLRTYPSKRIELTVADNIDPTHIMKICRANAVMAPRRK